MAAKVVEHLRATVPQFQKKDATGAFIAGRARKASARRWARNCWHLVRRRACCVGLLGIFIYLAIRFEFSFSLAAIIALIHDLPSPLV